MGDGKQRRIKTEWDRDTKNMSFIHYWYYQYLVTTALYFLEPWERHLFHSILFSFLAMTLYTAYIYIPYHWAHLHYYAAVFMDKLWS